MYKRVSCVLNDVSSQKNPTNVGTFEQNGFKPLNGMAMDGREIGTGTRVCGEKNTRRH